MGVMDAVEKILGAMSRESMRLQDELRRIERHRTAIDAEFQVLPDPPVALTLEVSEPKG
jgi:hypothetical protein